MNPIKIFKRVFKKLKGIKMSQVEQLLLAFLKKEATTNPQLAGKLLQEMLTALKADPTLANDVSNLVSELLPVILSAIK